VIHTLLLVAALSASSPCASPPMAGFDREHVVADVFHYSKVIRLGASPNAATREHRVVRELAPFVPRRSEHAVMLLHGDFATFVTNFMPAKGVPASAVLGLAPFFAQRDLDVWGVDRRWALTPTDGDVSDFGSMGVAQEFDDLRAALALARALRTTDGSGAGRVALLGFSHGAQLAYTYASVDAARPRAEQHLDALVALDFFGDYGPGVKTAAGRVTGERSGGVARFLGISYAAAPVGERRFAPPSPVERWAGARNALGFGAGSPATATTSRSNSGRPTAARVRCR
jgi:Carboxylesterase family